MANSPSVPQVYVTPFFVVSYYEDMLQNTPPQVFYPLMRTYEEALAFSNETVAANAGVGCCTIQQLDMTVVCAPHLLDVS